jgi:DivIVA domain-containing protein
MARKKKNRQLSSDTGDTPKRITPADIQAKEFRVALHGYHERDVDRFLDEVTEEVARLHAENRALREELDAARASPVDPVDGSAASVTAVAGGTVLSAFVARERLFLQGLADLIQSHAQAVKGDLARTRADRTPLEPPAEPPHDPVVDLTTVSRAEEEPEPVTSPRITEGPPIAGSASPEDLDDEDRSLRELFWGED